MLRLTIPQINDKVLFETILQPTDFVVNKLLKDNEAVEGEINTIRGRKNKVAIGVPYYENLISRLLKRSRKSHMKSSK